MKIKKTIFLVFLLIFAVLILAACGAEGEQGPPGEQGPQGEQGPPGPGMETTDLDCTECHNDTTLITGKHTAWEESGHGTGTAYLRGSRSSCAGCHSGGGFSERVAAGLSPGEVEAGDPNPTRQDCRACHQIHTTYTSDDWALETTDPVVQYAFEGQTFDGGDGNLCASCHQPRRVFPEAVDGQVEINSTHWGPHHGAETVMLMGIGGAGDVEGTPSKHYEKVEDTCVSCHMGENQNHSFEPVESACAECHDDVEADLEALQTEVQGLIDELGEELIALGLLDEEGHPAVQTVDEAYAAALWNWIYIAHEDHSLGVHNPSYTLDLLNWSLESLGK